MIWSGFIRGLKFTHAGFRRYIAAVTQAFVGTATDTLVIIHIAWKITEKGRLVTAVAIELLIGIFKILFANNYAR